MTHYIIIELQTMADGQVASLVHTAEARNAAESVYHQVLAAAALSDLPAHAAVLMSNEGFVLDSKCYLSEDK